MRLRMLAIVVQPDAQHLFMIDDRINAGLLICDSGPSSSLAISKLHRGTQGLDSLPVRLSKDPGQALAVQKPAVSSFNSHGEHSKIDACLLVQREAISNGGFTSPYARETCVPGPKSLFHGPTVCLTGQLDLHFLEVRPGDDLPVLGRHFASSRGR